MEKLELIFDGVENFKKDLKDSANTQFYFVGGCVRDLYLGRESKDIDIIVPHIDFEVLCGILGKYGTFELVGQSFPVVKFMPVGFAGTEPIDVAVPRIERSVGEGHKDFELIFNPEVTLEDDLKRRDFTINALAMDYEGNVIDLFGGLEDIEKKELRVITEQSFTDDPLRILRGLQFSARFGFFFDQDTIQKMMVHINLLKTVSPERVREEFEKGMKGDRNLFMFLIKLIQVHTVFELDIYLNQSFYRINGSDLSYIEMVDAYFNGVKGIDLEKLSKVFYLTAKEKTYLTILTELKFKDELTTLDIYLAGRKAPLIIDSNYFINIKENTYSSVMRFRGGLYPREPKELAVDGEFLMGKGYKGADIGKTQLRILQAIFNHELANNVPSIEHFLSLV